MTIWVTKRLLFKDIFVPLVSAMIGAAATLVVAMTGYLNKDKELDIKMLQIALGILREDPAKSKISAARSWAVDIINASAPVKIPKEARIELIKSPFKIPSQWSLDELESVNRSYYKLIENRTKNLECAIKNNIKENENLKKKIQKDPK